MSTTTRLTCEHERLQRYDALRSRVAFLVGYYGPDGAVPAVELERVLEETLRIADPAEAAR